MKKSARARAETTPRGRRRERIRRAILDNARRLVLERGASRLSLREVARASDYSPAALYEYFESKELLLDTLLEEGYERLVGELEAAADDATSAAGRLAAMGLAYVAFAERHPEHFELLFLKTVSPRKTLEEVTSVRRSPYTLLRAAVFEHLRQHGIDPEGEQRSEAATYGFWSLLHGMALLQTTYLRGFEADFAGADRVSIDCFIAGMVSAGAAA
jgi:AcrR family transcriptional regulator